MYIYIVAKEDNHATDRVLLTHLSKFLKKLSEWPTQTGVTYANVKLLCLPYVLMLVQSAAG